MNRQTATKTDDDFIDYYEVLQVNPKADTATIERVFRYLAQEFHPDNQETGNRDRFELLVRAYRTLQDPSTRAEFDVRHQRNQMFRWKLIGEATDDSNFDNDNEMQLRILSMLYVQRRRDVDSPAIGSMALSQYLGCPIEHINFHLWYLKEKGWIQRTDTGMWVITAEGVDRELSVRTQLGGQRMLTQEVAEPETG